MNPNTRVIVCCYAGDQHQIFVPAYTHHGCPVTVLSPEDSPANVPGVENRHGGLRAHVGKVSLDRQIAHLRIMLEYPEEFFFIHDSDSVCLDPVIPSYLYAEPNIVWANQVNDEIPEHEPFFPAGWPHIALQPPYFLSRTTIERMLAVVDDPLCAASPCMPFIDFYMVQLTMTAGLQWLRFLDGLSFPIAIDPRQTPDLRQRRAFEHGHRLAKNAVLNEGACILHAIKDPSVVAEFIGFRAQWRAKNPTTPPHFNPAPTIGR